MAACCGASHNEVAEKVIIAPNIEKKIDKKVKLWYNAGMARYKTTAKGQGLFLTVDLEEQIITDTYEFIRNYK